MYDERLDLAWNFMADSCALGNGKIGRNGRRIRAGEVCLEASASVGRTDAFKKKPPGERKVRVGKFSVFPFICQGGIPIDGMELLRRVAWR